MISVMVCVSPGACTVHRIQSGQSRRHYCFCCCCIIHVKRQYFMLELWVHVLCKPYVCGEHDIPNMTRGLSAGGMHLRLMSHRSSGWITANEIICLWEQNALSRWVYGNAHVVLVSLWRGSTHTFKEQQKHWRLRRSHLIDIKMRSLF